MSLQAGNGALPVHEVISRVKLPRRLKRPPPRPVFPVLVLIAASSPLVAQETPKVDAWGVPTRPVVAVGEIVGINVITWGLNYYIRDQDFAVVYPKTWWNNISNGFEYDGNLFATNMIDHPYHGSTYYNASRSNGIGFWGSAPLTLVGSLMWECCAERHPMAFNDVVNTTLGGRSRGPRVRGLLPESDPRLQPDHLGPNVHDRLQSDGSE
jgi:hypothetical protein